MAFLPASVLAYRAIDGHAPLRVPMLILVSLLFYGLWNPEFVPLLLGLIFVNWLAAGWFGRTQNGAIITAAIVLTLIILGFYKYADFVVANLTALTGIPLGRLNLTLPIGISFFTFHHIMYLADLRRGRAELTTFRSLRGLYMLFPSGGCWSPGTVVGGWPSIRSSRVWSRVGTAMRAGNNLYRLRPCRESCVRRSNRSYH